MSQRRLITLFGASLIAFAIALLWFSERDTKTNNKQNNLAELLPDFIIEDFNSQQFDVAGKLQYNMEAKKLIHYPMNDVTELSLPTMRFMSNEKSRWTVKSDQGFVASEGDIVELKGNVVLTSHTGDLSAFNSQSRGPVTMETDTLFIHIDKDKEFAETTKPVIISSTNSVVEAVGMQADFTDNRLILVSKVRGRHEIPTNQ